MNDLTFVIPYAPMHSAVHREAVASVKAQTIPCELIVYYDDEMRGAGFARNRGLAVVGTPLVCFLDADDTLDPHFAEHCLGILSQYAQSHEDTRYAYTDWLGVNNTVHQAPSPCHAWTEKTFHLVTAVIPTQRARLIGGFDEQMTGVEDADFYVRLRLSGLCGIHVEAPLVHYREGGQRSIQARATGQEAQAQLYMTNRYGGYNLMGCCGDNTQGPTGPTNEAQDGDVLAQALWHGNRVERGRATGRLYPRTSFPKLMYVALEDVTAAPQFWKQVTTPMEAANGVVLQPQYKSGGVPWQATAEAIFGDGQAQPVSNPIQYHPPTVKAKKADVVTKAQEWTRVEGDEL